MPWGYGVTSLRSLSPHGSHSPAPPVPVLKAWHGPALPRDRGNGSRRKHGSAGIETLFLPAPHGQS